MMEFQREDHLDMLMIMLGINDVSRAPVTPEGKWEPLLPCEEGKWEPLLSGLRSE